VYLCLLGCTVALVSCLEFCRLHSCRISQKAGAALIVFAILSYILGCGVCCCGCCVLLLFLLSLQSLCYCFVCFCLFSCFCRVVVAVIVVGGAGGVGCGGCVVLVIFVLVDKECFMILLYC
jgi:hypothetical protein